MGGFLGEAPDDFPGGMKKCPKCSAENLADAKFCEDCGAPLKHPAEGLVIDGSKKSRHNTGGRVELVQITHTLQEVRPIIVMDKGKEG